MFGINKLKMKKEELEQENIALRSALDRSNTANREMDGKIKYLTLTLRTHISEMNLIQEELNMNRSRIKAFEKYSDNSKNY